MLPNPRLEYDLDERLKAYLSAGFDAGTFRVGDHFGDDHRRSELNHATLDYLEARVGSGHLLEDLAPRDCRSRRRLHGLSAIRFL